MDNNKDYEEIYDQAGFFADIWEQLPEAFTKPLPEHEGENTTSIGMVIWDCSTNKTMLLATCSKCHSKNMVDDGICVTCKDCGNVNCQLND